MSLLTKAQILQADDLPTEDVQVPEWGGTVRVRTMTGKERDEFESSIVQLKQQGRKTTTERDLSNARAKLLSRTIVDAQGKLLFTMKDIEALGAKSARALDSILFPLVGTAVALIVRPASGVVSTSNPQFNGTGVLTSYPPLTGGPELVKTTITFAPNNTLTRTTA